MMTEYFNNQNVSDKLDDGKIGKIRSRGVMEIVKYRNKLLLI